MVEFGNEATVQSDLLRSILTVQIDLDKQGNLVVLSRCDRVRSCDVSGEGLRCAS